jgi:nicotinamide phosphoribosyltransferase
MLLDYNGSLPIRIRAVPEGLFIPLKHALFTIESTDEKYRWVPDWVETMFCRVAWYGSTVMCQSYYLRELIYSYLVKTSDNPDLQIPFKLHDFGARGASSPETAAIGGAAHLAIFRGSDNLEGIKHIKDYYTTWKGVRISISATQHSTITAWGRDNEVDAYRHMLHLYSGKGIFACVSDSWNIYNACAKLWGEELRQEIIDSGALVVIRPDSGDPIEVLFGRSRKDLIEENGKFYVKGKYTSHKDQLGAEVWGTYEKGKEVTSDQIQGVFGILTNKFGTTTNSKGYKVLNHVRVIQGDGVNPDSIEAILEKLTELGYSTDNIAFGMGGALLQKVDRDVNKFAYKCSSVVVNGEERDVFKQPVTDLGKESKKGRLDVVDNNGVIETVKLLPHEISKSNTIMRTIYENGVMFYDDTFMEIIERASL